MPAVVNGLVRVREADREGAQTPAAHPPPRPDELVLCGAGRLCPARCGLALAKSHPVG